jgi:hypothetical protein
MSAHLSIADTQGMMNHTTETIRATHNSASPGAMRSQQLLERLDRLERELADAFSVQPLPEALIERLVNEVSATELEIEVVRGRLVVAR